ncbi:MAG: KOW motif-containing protein [Candidatus Njordarchaeia archaeon]
MNESQKAQFFIVRVPRGREVEVIFLIRHRVKLYNLPIYAVFNPEDQEGVLFVEAADYNTVVRAVRHYRGAQVFPDPMSWEEIVSYLQPFQVKYERKEEEEEEAGKIEPGTIVEIIDGPFQGQKGRVVTVKKKKVWVDLMAGGAMLVPIPIEYVKPAES